MLKIIFFYEFFTNYNLPYINKYIDKIDNKCSLFFSQSSYIKILFIQILEIPLYYNHSQHNLITIEKTKNNDRFQVITRMKLSSIWKLFSSIDSLLTTPEAWVEKVARKMVKWVFKSFLCSVQTSKENNNIFHTFFSLYIFVQPPRKRIMPSL